MTPPQKPLGMHDFFALEAGEYLERLDALLGSESPSADELVRLARALRGSALMANQQAIARAAAGLEALTRALREGRRAWDPQTRPPARRARWPTAAGPTLKARTSASSRDCWSSSWRASPTSCPSARSITVIRDHTSSRAACPRRARPRSAGSSS